MKYIALFGLVSSIANVFINHGNDPAFWGWLSSSAWCLIVTVDSFVNDK